MQRQPAIEPFLPKGPSNILGDLCHLVADRAPVEVEILADLASRTEAVEQEYHAALKHSADQAERDKTAAVETYAAESQRVIARFESDRHTAAAEHDELRGRIEHQFESEQKAARAHRQETRWEASTLSEAAENGTSLELKETKHQVESQWKELLAIHRDAVEVLRRRWQAREYEEPDAAASPSTDPISLIAESVPLARDQLQRLSALTVPRMFEGAQPVGGAILFWLLSILPCGLLADWNVLIWVPASILSAAVLTLAVGGWLYRLARQQTTEAYLALRRTLAAADRARGPAVEKVEADCRRHVAEAVVRRDEELKKADDRFEATVKEITERRESDVQRADRQFSARSAEISSRRDGDLQAAEDVRADRMREIGDRYQAELTRIQGEYARERKEIEEDHRTRCNEMARRWQTGMADFQASVDSMNHECERLFLGWDDSTWDDWRPPRSIPPAIRFGHHEVALDQIENGIPRDQRLIPDRLQFALPALLPFPDSSMLLLETDGGGGDRAVDVLRAVMLRMLTSIPPGKVRFTIIDPVGLGENFSAFMHLADYDEKLVAGRIWTERGHIEKQLGDLTGHMENVIQVYLRNEFPSLREYNEFAGEMAEPYRVLVIANFPANFTEAAAARLKSIVASGSRCGVFTLMTIDTKQKLPRHFDMADLHQHACRLTWEEESFITTHDGYGRMPLVVDELPDADRFTEIVRTVGKRVQEVDRVEVPIDCVLPEDGEVWTADSRGGIDLPLGRAGAMKLQHLSLGKGTAQHVLVSGKTGSGKSTMLHVLIANIALRYSPDEVHLYLVDFKKGVEFKAYATGELAHARVIAIESEREFGLSVLQRLDEELKTRGDLFRRHGVQDIASYRDANPEAVMPRILLIIDEFQELFVEDDRIAQDAALLLDRLVRQGRAFGIHVLLGSQTLGGAYSLARSTIGQMAVRIALQCSEADAHLILSEDNTAARLLTRPGEAIYNDANGLFEGNHPFQVAWMSDRQRDECLRRARQLVRERQVKVPPAIVFEGNVLANPKQNAPLCDLLDADSWPEPSHATQAWVGAAVAIKDPTSATLIRQSGSNVLLVGHRDEAALGVLATMMISMAAQHRPAETSNGVQFIVLDGARPDAPEAGFWNRLAPAVPHGVKVVSPRNAAAAVEQIDEELIRREEAEQEDAPPIFLVVFDLGRFRDLRKTEDDFGFSRFDEDAPPSAAKRFSHILREGPALGVHTLIWADTYNNVNRCLDRQNLHDIEMRITFHMNATDSSNLIDSPLASRLDANRALLYDEGRGGLEKFRPYGLPDGQWLDWVKQRLYGRT